MITKKKTAIIIGTGIAGLSIAEILSRNKYKVVLIEKQNKIGGEASLATQKWYHTGWLYAALPNSSAMYGCYNALHLFQKIYKNIFSNEIINLDLSNGVEYLDSEKGWFTNERIYYYYAIASYDLSFLDKIYWPLYLNLLAFRRLRKLNYKIEIIKNYDKQIEILLNSWEGTRIGYKDYKVIRSTDAKIETERVMRSLVSVLSKDTEILTNTSFELTNNNKQTGIKINGILHNPDLLIIASGKSIPVHLTIIGSYKIANKIKSIKSPIIVLKEALELPDFIRFTPNVEHTVNHIKLKVNNNKQVSTIGSYYSFPIKENPDLYYYESLMRRRIGVSKDKILGSYYGIKTEFVGSRDRRYNHAVMKVNNNTFFALAGKLSQFPLLVHDFANQTGLSLKPQNSNSKISIDESIFASTFPEDLINNKKNSD